ncbi:hypothetical protein EL003_00605 [Salmonella enterica subsp. salamae serovar 42:r:-]|nr:hypothetical protein EL003_00605 [Salmonella enterica subsp. salamae serovar 42:r:-]
MPPRDGDSAWSLTPEQFDWLVSGIDWQKMSGHDGEMGMTAITNLMILNEYPCRKAHNTLHGYHRASLHQRPRHAA